LVQYNGWHFFLFEYVVLSAESLDYFQQGDSSADEGGPGTEEAASASAMDTGNPRTATNFVRRTSSNPENPPAEPSASTHAPARRQAFHSRDLEPDSIISLGGAMHPSTLSPTNPASAAPSADILDANSDAGEKFRVPFVRSSLSGIVVCLDEK
jgi:hypothetical protein